MPHPQKQQESRFSTDTETLAWRIPTFQPSMGVHGCSWEAMMLQWKDREEFLRDEAQRDLEDGDDVRPCFLAWAGERPLFLAFMRPYAKGTHLNPLIELIALAAPLDADRLAVSLGGRAWSMQDPLPPVLPGEGDLRQRVLVIEEADGSRGRARPRSSALPFDLVDGAVTWGTPIRHEGETGLVSAALALAVRQRRQLRAPDPEILKQAERCVRLGHMVALSGPVHDRLVA